MASGGFLRHRASNSSVGSTVTQHKQISVTYDNHYLIVADHQDIPYDVNRRCLDTVILVILVQYDGRISLMIQSLQIK